MVSMVETFWERMVARMMSETGAEQDPGEGCRAV